MTTDYKKVAETLSAWLPEATPRQNDALDAAIDLCERFCRGELVERERVAELKEALDHIASAQDRIAELERELVEQAARAERNLEGCNEAVSSMVKNLARAQAAETQLKHTRERLDALVAAAGANPPTQQRAHGRVRTSEGGSWCPTCGADHEVRAKLGKLSTDADCPGPTRPQDPSDADIARKWMDEQTAEREHCEHAVYTAPTGMLAKQQWLIRERAAAYQAGYERGRSDGEREGGGV